MQNKQNKDTEQIVLRFFQALVMLKEQKVIGGKQTFANKYDINRRNMYFIEKNPGSGMFEPAWLMYLVRDFDVSAQWLLTGTGEFKKAPKLANFSHASLKEPVSF